MVYISEIVPTTIYGNYLYVMKYIRGLLRCFLVPKGLINSYGWSTYLRLAYHYDQCMWRGICIVPLLYSLVLNAGGPIRSRENTNTQLLFFLAATLIIIYFFSFF